MDLPSGVNTTNPRLLWSAPTESLKVKSREYRIGRLKELSGQFVRVSSLNPIISNDRFLGTLLLIRSFAIICLLSLSKLLLSHDAKNSILIKVKANPIILVFNLILLIAF